MNQTQNFLPKQPDVIDLNNIQRRRIPENPTHLICIIKPYPRPHRSSVQSMVHVSINLAFRRIRISKTFLSLAHSSKRAQSFPDYNEEYNRESC